MDSTNLGYQSECVGRAVLTADADGALTAVPDAAPLFCDTSGGASISTVAGASVFDDSSGSPYMLFGALAGPTLWVVALTADGSAVSSWPPECVDDPAMIITGLAKPCEPEPATTAVELGMGKAYPVLAKPSFSALPSISASVVRYHGLYYLFFTATDGATGDAIVQVGLSAAPLEPYVDVNGAPVEQSEAPTVVLVSESPRYEHPTSLGVAMYLDNENLAQFVLTFLFVDSTDKDATKLGMRKIQFVDNWPTVGAAVGLPLPVAAGGSDEFNFADSLSTMTAALTEELDQTRNCWYGIGGEEVCADVKTNTKISAALSALGPIEPLVVEAEEASPPVPYAWCADDGTDSTYGETLDVEAMERRIVASGCPNYARPGKVGTGVEGRAPAARQDLDVGVPLFPYLGAPATAVAADDGAAMRGVLRSGVAVYDSWDAEAAALWPSADECGGYVAGGSEYRHYSTATSNPSCLAGQLGTGSGTESGHSAQLGWAIDGFPQYGAAGLGGVEMKPCGSEGADATLCLDECYGWEGELVGVDSYRYRYYSGAAGEGGAHCLRGCVAFVDDAEAAPPPSARVPKCTAGAEAGYVAGFVPAKLTSPGLFVAAEEVEGEKEDGGEGTAEKELAAEEGEEEGAVELASSEPWINELNVTDTDLDQNNEPVKDRLHCYYVDPTAGTDGTTRRVCHMTDGAPFGREGS